MLPLRFAIFVYATVLAGIGNAGPRVLAVNLDGVVHPVTTEIVTRALDQAQQEHFELVLIRLNTPGGLMDAMRQSIDTAQIAPGRVLLEVSARAEHYVTVKGVDSCNVTDDCPDGKTCATDSTCQ